MFEKAWKPWHQVVVLRRELRSGRLPLHMFAADLDDVVAARARRPSYADPAAFFALTYPTFSLRDLARDVLGRLAGRNERAVYQLELTYGGGKTHTLIALYHLVHDPAKVRGLAAVQEFRAHAGVALPRARVAALCLDKLDAERGMRVLAPDGRARWLRHPWSVLAYQLAGDAGLRMLTAGGSAEERDSATAENLLVELLAVPAREGLATLVLLDEVLVYVREKVAADPAWRGRLANFFQCLTQAASRVDRCCVVASLLAADPRRSDALGKKLAQELGTIFRRQRDRAVLPVAREDVAEILRRRFFECEGSADEPGVPGVPGAGVPGAGRSAVLAALQGIRALGLHGAADPAELERRFLDSYPFHPELLDVLYTKWTNLEGFQRTRGVLRTFAVALRAAAAWDPSPVVGLDVFLAAPGATGLAEAARELTTIAEAEEYEGRRHAWASILESELDRARQVQAQLVGLRCRELEQAVLGTFLHSQPLGQKAQRRDLLNLVGPTGPDAVELHKALRAWMERSYWLDDRFFADAGDGLAACWRLGNRPNLNQMHAEACRRVSDSAIDVRLLEQIGRCAALTEGADGVRVHHLPASPRQVADDSAMHFAVLGPSAACEPGAPSAEARRFLDEGSGPDRPRVYRNALVLAVPTPEGVELMRQAIRGWLAWRQVGAQLDEERTDAARLAVWKQSVETARRRVAEAIRAAYAVAVAVDPANQVDAYRLSSAGGSGLFAVIRRDPRLRVRDGPVNDQALLPGGPYNLWRDGESARRVKDLVGAFAQYPHLPRMVHRRAIVETIVEGCARGQFVLQRAGRNGPTRSWWFRRPEPGVLDEPDLELALPAGARLAELCPALLEPGVLPNLWDGDRLPLPRAHAYFAGGRVERVAAESDEVEVPIPVADRSLVDRAVSESVGSGRLWLRCGTASVCGDPVPAPLLRDSAAVLAPPPLPLAPTDVVASSIPAAWRSGRSTAAAVATALLERAGVDLPWGTVRAALSAAIGARLVEALPGGAPWPCGSAEAARVELRLLYDRPIPAAGQRGRGAVAEPATVELAPHQIQDLGEQVHRIVRAGAGLGVRFLVRVEAVRRDAAGARAAAEVNRLLAEICPQLRIS